MEYLLLHISLGPLLLLISILFRIFPPKSINFLYGYRTARSMKTQASWDAANKFGPNAMIIGAAITCLLQLVFGMMDLSITNYTIFSAGSMVILLVATIPLTEAYLKRHFDQNGNPVQK